MLHADDICAASERLTVLVMGTNDLAQELQAEHVPGPPAPAWRTRASACSPRATGKAILDGVYNDITDAEGFEAECRQGRELGFDGKTLIHPSQLEPCNRVFAPSADEIAKVRGGSSKRFDEAQAEGHGVVTVDGRIGGSLHVERAPPHSHPSRSDQDARSRRQLAQSCSSGVGPGKRQRRPDRHAEAERSDARSV